MEYRSYRVPQYEHQFSKVNLKNCNVDIINIIIYNFGGATPFLQNDFSLPCFFFAYKINCFFYKIIHCTSTVIKYLVDLLIYIVNALIFAKAI